MVSVCLPSDALLQHLPSYLGFSYLGHGVSLHGCSSKGWIHIKRERERERLFVFILLTSVFVLMLLKLCFFSVLHHENNVGQMVLIANSYGSQNKETHGAQSNHSPHATLMSREQEIIHTRCVSHWFWELFIATAKTDQYCNIKGVVGSEIAR